MKMKLCFLALLVCFCQLAKAQTTDTPSFKNHLGVVASPTLHKVFTSNSSLPVGLIYKRQGSGNGLFRSTLIGSQTNYSQNVVVPYSTSDIESSSKSFSVQLTGGYEWHVPLHPKWGLYYGAEAGPTYGRNISEHQHPNYNSTGHNSHSQNYRAFGAVIRPFSGIAYRVTDRLSIATETAIVASLSRSKNKMTDEQTTSANPSSTEHSYKTDWSNITYKPISNISLLMQF